MSEETPVGPVSARPYREETDRWAVRALLIRTQSTTPPGWNWDIRRWDGLRYHHEAAPPADVTTTCFGVWVTVDDVLVGAVHGEGPGDACFQLDPGYRHLEPAMVDWAEQRLAISAGGYRRLEVTVLDDDLERRAVPSGRGYEMLDAGVWFYRLRFDDWQAPITALADGYVARTTTAATLDGDAERMAALLNAAFGRTFHSAAEYRRLATGSPSFRHDLNLVAEAADGSFAAHVGVTFDADNRHGIIEPVCTHPDHVRHGLARHLVIDGLRRVQALGAVTASVDTGDMEPANALYQACGFTESFRGHVWRRDLGEG